MIVIIYDTPQALVFGRNTGLVDGVFYHEEVLSETNYLQWNLGS